MLSCGNPCHFRSIHSAAVCHCLCQLRSICFWYLRLYFVSASFHRSLLPAGCECQFHTYMFYGCPCQLRAAFYIRTIGFKIVFRVIFFPPHLTGTAVSRANFVSATFHHFSSFCVSFFPSFSLFSWLCHVLLVSITLHHFMFFHCLFGVSYVPYFWPLLRFFLCFPWILCHLRVILFRLFSVFLCHLRDNYFLFFRVGFVPCFCLVFACVVDGSQVRSSQPALFPCRVVATVSCGSLLLPLCSQCVLRQRPSFFAPVASLFIRSIGYRSSAFR